MEIESRKNLYSKDYYKGFSPEPRFEKVANVFAKLKGENLLDIGCGDGEITLLLRDRMNAKYAYGVELSPEAVGEATKKGVKAYHVDLDNDNLPFEGDFFDVIYCGEIIEHVFDPDHLLSEVKRVLKQGGTCVLSTPNLAGWSSRFALLLGYQPYPMAASPGHESAGKLIVNGAQGQWGHIRVLTFRALKELVNLHGFTIKQVIGCPVTIKSSGSKLFFLKTVNSFDRFFSRLPQLSTSSYYCLYQNRLRFFLASKFSFPKVSVVICALNEEKNLCRVLPGLPAWVDEVILVDGHSVDRTVKVAIELRPDIRTLSQPNKGKGEALKFGVAAAKNDIIVTLDADGTYPPEEMLNFVNMILNGNDLAKGTRFIGAAPECMPRNRQFGNKILALTTNILFHSHYTDVCTGYYAFRKGLFNEIDLSSDGFEIEQELFAKAAKMNYRIAEVPHSYRKREYGVSKTQDFRQGFKDLAWIIFLFFSTPKQTHTRNGSKRR